MHHLIIYTKKLKNKDGKMFQQERLDRVYHQNLYLNWKRKRNRKNKNCTLKNSKSKTIKKKRHKIMESSKIKNRKKNIMNKNN